MHWRLANPPLPAQNQRDRVTDDGLVAMASRLCASASGLAARRYRVVCLLRSTAIRRSRRHVTRQRGTRPAGRFDPVGRPSLPVLFAWRPDRDVRPAHHTRARGACVSASPQSHRRFTAPSFSPSTFL